MLQMVCFPDFLLPAYGFCVLGAELWHYAIYFLSLPSDVGLYVMTCALVMK